MIMSRDHFYEIGQFSDGRWKERARLDDQFYISKMFHELRGWSGPRILGLKYTKRIWRSL